MRLRYNQSLEMNIRLIILLIVFSHLSHAQFTTPVLENNRPSIKWHQTNSPNFRVLYHKGGDSLAMQTINTLEKIYKPSLSTLNTNPEKVTIILQQLNATSNGFVTVGPRRSEFYGMPPQNYNFTGTNQWMDMLAVHEYRHVVQFSKSRIGFNKVISYLFGEVAYGAMAHLAMPSWFWEGDAVGIETALTHSGRGRIASFSMPYKTNLLTHGPFSYDKQMLRSFKHFVPDHYVSGYYMTTHMRRVYGSDIWDKITNRAFYTPFLPWRLPVAMKRETGKGLIPHYQSMTTELTEIWQKQIDDLEETQVERKHSRKNETYTSYNYPQVNENGEIVVLKSGLSDVQQFVMFHTDGKESKVFTPGVINDAGMLSLSGDKLVYVEQEYHPRWLSESYSVVKILDIKKGKIRKVTSKSRYASASLSPDQQFIVTVHTDENHKTNLAVLDSKTGKEVKRFPNPDNEFYQMPRWSDDGKSITVLKIKDQKKSIVLVDYTTEAEEVIVPYTFENFGHPVKYKNYLFYNSAYNGIDNIYAINLNTGIHYQVTSRKYGAFNPVITADGKNIVFNDYTSSGMDVVSMPFEPVSWKPKTKIEDRNTNYHQPLVLQENNEDVLLDNELEEYPASRYSKLKGLINPYSWGLYSSTSADDFMVGVLSQDVLSTTTISGGYQFDTYGDKNRLFAKVSYQGLFPIIDAGVESIYRSGLIREDEELHPVTFTELKATAGLRIPLLLTKSRYHEQMTIGTDASFGELKNFKMNNRDIGPPERTTYGMLRYNFSYYRLYKQSKRDIRSKWGQYLFAQYSHLPLGGDFTGNQWSMKGILLFPGLFKHHSLQLSGGMEFVRDSTYPFDTYLNSPRGYDRFFHDQFYNASLDYALPLWYPDINLSSLINIQRIKTSLFFDTAFGDNEDHTRYRYNSIGAEISADVNFLRLLPLFEVGFRYAFVPDSRFHYFGFMLGSFSL